MGVIEFSVGVNGKNGSQDVIAVQALLNAWQRSRPAAVPRLALDGLCGKRTQDAIRQFQRVVLPVTPATGLVEPTRPMIQQLVVNATLQTRVMYPRSGSKQDIIVVQALLNRFRSSDRLKLDGVFGPKTLAALQQVQQAASLVPSPAVDPGSESFRQLREGNHDPKRATPKVQQSAREMVSQFQARTGNPAFVNIDRATVARSLVDRIESPSRIKQNASSLCGAMSLLYFVARASPALYVKYVIDLYESGEGSINKLKVKPGESVKNGRQSSEDPADWIASASLRDSENSFLPYNAPGKESAGITPSSDMVKWLKNVGATNILDKTSYIHKGVDDGLNNLLTAGTTCSNAKSWVFLLIDAGVIAPIQKPAITQYHWVALLSANVKKTGIRLELFTWGKKRIIPEVDHFMAPSTFMKYYHGHISCTGISA